MKDATQASSIGISLKVRVRVRLVFGVQNGKIFVSYRKSAHNPVLRAVQWENLLSRIPWLGNAQLEFKFR